MHRIARVKAHIELNLAGDLSLKTLAGLAALSPRQFSLLFKQVTGISPGAFVLARRLSEAERRLAETALPIAAIGEGVGFRSASSFGAAFRKAKGVSPRQFRAGLSRPRPSL